MKKFLALSMTSLFVMALVTAVFADEGARARDLLNSLGCKGCHQLQGAGGTLGPALDDIGKRKNRAQIQEELVNPKADDPNSMMPSFQNLPPADLKALVDFLAGLK